MGKNVCVVVLGDIGRSPRMQYHSIALAENGHKVDIVGYRGSTPLEELTAKPLVSFHFLNEYPNLPLPRIANYVLKAIWQLISLLIVFAIVRRADYILVQNPPAVPTLFACYIYKILSRARLVIDWHNYAHSIMALTNGPTHILVKLTKYMEKLFGGKADFNLCVTNEMKLDLENRWDIKPVHTLYDRPASMFKSISLEGKHSFLLRFQQLYSDVLSEEMTGDNETAFTHQLDDNRIVLKPNRPGLIVSSTSWTPDEDFKVLFGALQYYEQHHLEGNALKLPRLVCVITGNGPMKACYQKVIKDAKWQNVCVITPWLEAKDYPKMLAAADLGVSLHTSSSGLDLPMKVVDMFGCGLPVCAHDFKCLHELVVHDKNGFIFSNSEELSAQLQQWFKNFPNDEQQIRKQEEFKNEINKFQSLRWTENWQRVAGPLFH